MKHSRPKRVLLKSFDHRHCLTAELRGDALIIVDTNAGGTTYYQLDPQSLTWVCETNVVALELKAGGQIRRLYPNDNDHRIFFQDMLRNPLAEEKLRDALRQSQAGELDDLRARFSLAPPRPAALPVTMALKEKIPAA